MNPIIFLTLLMPISVLSISCYLPKECYDEYRIKQLNKREIPDVDSCKTEKTKEDVCEQSSNGKMSKQDKNCHPNEIVQIDFAWDHDMDQVSCKSQLMNDKNLYWSVDNMPEVSKIEKMPDFHLNDDIEIHVHQESSPPREQSVLTEETDSIKQKEIGEEHVEDPANKMKEVILEKVDRQAPSQVQPEFVAEITVTECDKGASTDAKEEASVCEEVHATEAPGVDKK